MKENFFLKTSQGIRWEVLRQALIHAHWASRSRLLATSLDSFARHLMGIFRRKEFNVNSINRDRLEKYPPLYVLKQRLAIRCFKIELFSVSDLLIP